MFCFLFLPFFSLAPERTQTSGILMDFCFQHFFYKFRKLKECKSLLKVFLGFYFLILIFFFLTIYFSNCVVWDFFHVIHAEDNEKKLSYLLRTSMEQKFAKPSNPHDPLLQFFNHSCSIFEYIIFAFPAIFVQQKCPVEVFPLLKSSIDTEIMRCISRFHIHFDVLKSSELCKVARNRRNGQKQLLAWLLIIKIQIW